MTQKEYDEIQIAETVEAIAKANGFYCYAIGGRFVVNGVSVLFSGCRESIGELIKLSTAIVKATGLKEVGFFSKGNYVEMLGAI